MSLSISLPVRLAAMAGLLAALLLGAAALLLARTHSSSSAPAKLVRPLQRPGDHRAAALKPARPASGSGHRPAVTPAVPARAAEKPRPAARGVVGQRPAAVAPATASGLPAPIASALAQHKVVVVSLFAPGAQIDDLATLEASAGAALAGAGYVAVNVLDQSQAAPLTAYLSRAGSTGVIGDPAVLVFRRPGDIYLKITGFVDRETVAQVVANAGT